MARSERHAIVVRTGPRPLKRLLQADLRAALDGPGNRLESGVSRVYGTLRARAVVGRNTAMSGVAARHS